MDTKTFDKFDERTFLHFSNPSQIEKDLQTLVGILTGIRNDGIINNIEYTELLKWLQIKKPYEEKQPYKEVIGLIREAISDNHLSSGECEDMIWFCNEYIKKTGYYDVITASLQKLLGIVKGMVIDHEVNIGELAFLDQWLEENEYLKNSWPYDELYSLSTKIIQDSFITEEEHVALISFCNALVGDTSNNSNNNQQLISTLKTGFCQIDPKIVIPENTFCITGLSKKFKRREIAEKIELYGGYVVDNISSKLDYLVACNEKNICWAFTCHGRKIEEAIKLRKKGNNIVIVHEFDLYDTFESLSD